MSKQYKTKTGVILTVINGGGLGNGVPKGILVLVPQPSEAPKKKVG